MTELDNCFSKKLLIKTRPELDLAQKDVRQAEYFLKEAMDLINLEKYGMANIALYNAYFHAARALLFKDGIKEKSHFCLARYIEDRYAKKDLIKSQYVEALDALRELRHEVQYGFSMIEIDSDELLDYCKICEELIQQISLMIK